MIARMIPLSQQLHFEVGTEDFMFYRRPIKTKSKESAPKGTASKGKKSLLGKRNSTTAQASQDSTGAEQQKAIQQQDLMKQLQYRSILGKRFKALKDGLVLGEANAVEYPAH